MTVATWGTVFELIPASDSRGNWTESILWNFGDDSDGSWSQFDLIMDSKGNIFGTTSTGGAYAQAARTVLRQGNGVRADTSAIAGGAWTESVLWNFGNGTDGGSPESGHHGWQRQSLRHDLNGRDFRRLRAVMGRCSS